MQYCHTTLFSIKGISLSASENERLIIADSSGNLRAILTSQPDKYMFEGDRSLAIAGLILQGLFKSEPTDSVFKQRVANAVDEIQAVRNEEYGKSSFLIVIEEGDISSFNPKYEKDAIDYVICFDGVDKKAIRASFNDKCTAIVNSIILGSETVIGIKQVADSVIFFLEDSRPVYSYTFSGGSQEVYVSKPLCNDQLQLFGELYSILTTDTGLMRVQKLIRSSFDSEDDPLRSFLAAWSAFEIFVNKVFNKYEKSFFNTFVEEGCPGVKKKYIKRIQEVMNDKYRLTDKFDIVSLYLSPGTSDKDCEAVMEIKKLRDELLHGDSVEESTLLVKTIRDLVNKYFLLYIKREFGNKMQSASKVLPQSGQ